MEDAKQNVKRFLHDNAVTLITILIFVLILAMLIAARYGSLLSISNIANINPLITSESAELVAVNVNGVIQIIKDDDGKVTEAEKKAATKDKNSTGNSSQGGGTTTGGSGSSGGSSGGGSGSSGGGTSGGGGSSSPSPSSSPSSSPSPSPSPSSSPSPSPSPGPLMASIQSLTYIHRETNDEVWVPLFGWTCENNHTFKITVKATSGSGDVKVRWKQGNATRGTSDLGTMTNGETRSAEFTLRDQSSGGSITAEVIKSGNTVMDSGIVNYNHSCNNDF